MTAALIDGKHVASLMTQTLKDAIHQMRQAGKAPLGLAVILIGNDPASAIYVHNKRKACEAVGIQSMAYDLPMETTETKLLGLIHQLNQQVDVSGILVQLPLPAHINTSRIIEHISPAKDVDGFHPYNLGRLAQGNPGLRPCTPFGIMTLLTHYGLPVKGQHAVVVGSSTIVGRPMALELLSQKATVTICHRSTHELEKHVRMADILVIATGTPDSINPDWLQSHQVVIDVGIHRGHDGRLRGDIDFERAKDKVAWITPVPGGVGPMTIASLLQNTLLTRAR